MGIFQRGKLWYLDYYFGSKRIREKFGPSKGEAEKALASRQTDIARGKFNFAPKSLGPLFGVFAEQYLNLVSIQKRCHNNERYVIRQLVRVFGKRRISELTAEDGEGFKTVRARYVKPATVNRELTVLKHMLRTAFKWELLPKNPFRDVQFLHVPKSIERILSTQEELKLLQACDRVRGQFLKPLVVLALQTGMRRSELLTLRWHQIDLGRRTLRIINAKTVSGDRVVPMNDTACRVLTDLATKRTSEFAFPSSRRVGERLVDLKKGFKKTVQIAGIPHIRFHDLRHTFATRLVQAGVDLITVRQLLGHARITMTVRYAHSPTEARIAAVMRLDAQESVQSDPNRTREHDLMSLRSEFKAPPVNNLGS